MATSSSLLRSYNRCVRCVSSGDHARWPALRASPSICLRLAIAALVSLSDLSGRAACPGTATTGHGQHQRARAIGGDRPHPEQCLAIDQNDDGRATIGELIMAVNAALNGCPGAPTATPLNTHTAVPSPTPTAVIPSPTPTTTVNLPPVLPTPFIYRTYPDFPIQLPVGVTDPEGKPLQCAAENLPPGATFDDANAVLSWTPTEQQLGAFYVPYTCSDDATQSVAGTLTFRVSARDSCAVPTCDPATGCTTTLPPPSQSCCGAGPAERVPEPVAECPAGRVLYIGQNDDIDVFGRLQNCDVGRGNGVAPSPGRSRLRRRDALHEHAQPPAHARPHGEQRGEPQADVRYRIDSVPVRGAGRRLRPPSPLSLRGQRPGRSSMSKAPRPTSCSRSPIPTGRRSRTRSASG